MDCGFWADGNKRKAYKFHLTDNPTWADLLTKENSVVQANSDMTSRLYKRHVILRDLI